jgi:hypothetical protein
MRIVGQFGRRTHRLIDQLARLSCVERSIAISGTRGCRAEMENNNNSSSNSNNGP